MTGISVRTRFERFPATVKGAFIVRGEDADPHQIIFRRARVVRIGDADGMALPMKVDLLTVAPHQDLFLPFEYPTTDLSSGWYTMQLELEVDGRSAIFDDGRRFSSPWPRGSIRRGAVGASDVLQAGSAMVTITGLDCNADTATLRATVAPAEAAVDVALRLRADGEPLPLIEIDADPATGEIAALAFPILRAHRELTIAASTDSAWSETATVKLPG